jgi:hypothetical protein
VGRLDLTLPTTLMLFQRKAALLMPAPTLNAARSSPFWGR